MMRKIAMILIAVTLAGCSARQPLRTSPRWTLPAPRTTASITRVDGRPMLDGRAGLCPLDVKGLMTEMRVTHDRVLLLAQAPPGPARDELGERARIMTYTTLWLWPAAHDDRIGQLPIGVEVSVQAVNGSLLLTFKPREPWKLRELAETIDNERRWLGRDECNGSLETVQMDHVPLAAPRNQ